MKEDTQKQRVECAYKKLVPLEELIPNPRNPNKHPDRQIEMLANNMKRLGIRSPIVVSNRSGFIVKGHGRLMAAQSLGVKKYPVDFQDYESEAKEYADMVADNKLAEQAASDELMIIEDARRLKDEIEDFDLLGIDGFILPEDEEEENERADAIPENLETRCKLGDLWQLGEHRLLCGDCTDESNIERLMNGEKADMVFTDPPYGVSYEKKCGEIAKQCKSRRTSKINFGS